MDATPVTPVWKEITGKVSCTIYLMVAWGERSPAPDYCARETGWRECQSLRLLCFTMFISSLYSAYRPVKLITSILHTGHIQDTRPQQLFLLLLRLLSIFSNFLCRFCFQWPLIISPSLTKLVRISRIKKPWCRSHQRQMCLCEKNEERNPKIRTGKMAGRFPER